MTCLWLPPWCLLAAVFIVVMNTIVDIVYAFLDPRVRLS